MKINVYVKLHIAVALFGMSAILGVLISLDPISLVWWRMTLSSMIIFLALLITKRITKELMNKSKAIFLLLGVLISLHWVTFFASIKFANASIALLSMSTVSLMTALIEPIVLKKRISKMDLLIGTVVVLVIFFLTNSYEGDYYMDKKHG